MKHTVIDIKSGWNRFLMSSHFWLTFSVHTKSMADTSETYDKSIPLQATDLQYQLGHTVDHIFSVVHPSTLQLARTQWPISSSTSSTKQWVGQAHMCPQTTFLLHVLKSCVRDPIYALDATFSLIFLSLTAFSSINHVLMWKLRLFALFASIRGMMAVI